MKISHNWLSEYLSDIPDAEQTAHLLTLTGLEVEETVFTGNEFDGIVAGKVLSVQKHPQADRLTVCEVDTGSGRPEQIVCGAPNVAAGQVVPVARVGCELPVALPDGSPFRIKKTKIRGVESHGMICAEDELGLGEDHSGIMVLDEHWQAGTPFAQVLGRQPDAIFEIGLTPNRPDAACHLGVARDLSAVTGHALKKPFDGLPAVTSTLPEQTIQIVDTDKCHRYVGIHLRGVTIGESPAWLADRLRAIGLRPVNNVVDSTNYVLHELGQPLHAFDFEQLADRKIEVRSFDQQVAFTTLDEAERNVPAGSLFICDGEKPVALAGVMGGLNSEITPQTTELLIESAWFDPVSVRKTARELALQTDSSYRFERGVDPKITKKAALRCAQLILKYGGGSIVGMTDAHPVPVTEHRIVLRHERLNAIVGTNIPGSRVKHILEQLGFGVQRETVRPGEDVNTPCESGCRWLCRVPSFRPDVREEIDLIEEVARIYDYNRIPDPVHMTMAAPAPLPWQEIFREKVRQAAVSAGMQEIYTNSLLPERLLDSMGGEHVVVPTLNPITRDQALLRTRLVFGFLRSAAWNFNRKAPGVSLFEIGNIFRNDPGAGTYISGIHESTHLLLGLAGNTHADHWRVKARPWELQDLKGLVVHVLRQLSLHEQVVWQTDQDELVLGSVGKKSIEIGRLGAVPEQWKQQAEVQGPAFVAELDLAPLQALADRVRRRRYEPVSRFPAFEFDLALVVKNDVASGALQSALLKAGGSSLVSCDVFDVFEGGSLEKGEKSIAFRLLFQDTTKTLTINDVEPVVNHILKVLSRQYQARLRS